MALRGTLTHFKTRILAESLEIEPAHALGLLEALWHATAQDAPSGNIGRLPNRAIAMQMFTKIDPDRLIGALVQSGHLDEHPEHRLLVHDWNQHADYNTKRKVARAHGSMFTTGGNVPPIVRHDASHFADDRIPEPEPEPEPGPMSAAPLRFPVATQSPGANGEFMAATGLMQELRLAATAGDIRVMAQVIALESTAHGGIEATTDWLKERAEEARSRGESVTVFWFKDRKFDKGQRNSLEWDEFKRAGGIGD